MYISPFPSSSTPQGYSVSQIRTAYNLPSSGGNGTTIAIIDAYHTSNILTCYTGFCSQYGLPDNSTGNFKVYTMPGTIGTDGGWAFETSLDVEWAHAIAPDAKILLVEAVDNSYPALLSAVDYATSQSGVVAVSMSWGDNESSVVTSYDSHFNKPGITFFASSGDDGSFVNWPAVSTKVVSVGGTTLNLNANGGVVSETAWSGSSGGVSHYVAQPGFQTSFGLSYSNRAVPDVSYDGDPSTGVAVYNGTWWKVGGTSVGAPQWAAIHALGLSVTNANLYARAKTAYSSFFRDITTGSNNVNNANVGYDLVTGLGSPVTTNFGTEVTISPTSGPPQGAITFNGVGFTASSVNISYLNPKTNTWVPLINNLTISSEFTYNFSAPDLNQSNLAGDNQPLSDNIIFRVQVDSSHSYNSTTPYAEWLRGLTQLSNSTAQGIYGNNTNLASSVFVQSGDMLPICGENFAPGNVTFLWDGSASLGTVLTDNTGYFTATVQVPATPPGQHQLVLSDSDSDFCFNLTSLPRVTDNYTDAWYTSNFTIKLIPDSTVNETFYIINGGQTFNVTANGQPAITTEGGANTLKYWSTWNINATNTIQTPHITINGIKLDKTAPTGTISTSPTTSSTTITLALSASDAISGVSQMSFSNDGTTWSGWEPYATSKSWTITTGDGTKTIYVEYEDNAGLTATYSTTTVLNTTPPTTPPPSPTLSPSQSTSPISTATEVPTQTPTPIPSTSPDIPELNIQIVFILLALLTIPLAFKLRRK